MQKTDELFYIKDYDDDQIVPVKPQDITFICCKGRKCVIEVSGEKPMQIVSETSFIILGKKLINRFGAEKFHIFSYHNKINEYTRKLWDPAEFPISAGPQTGRFYLIRNDMYDKIGDFIVLNHLFMHKYISETEFTEKILPSVTDWEESTDYDEQFEILGRLSTGNQLIERYLEHLVRTDELFRSFFYNSKVSDRNFVHYDLIEKVFYKAVKDPDEELLDRMFPFLKNLSDRIKVELLRCQLSRSLLYSGDYHITESVIKELLPVINTNGLTRLIILNEAEDDDVSETQKKIFGDLLTILNNLSGDAVFFTENLSRINRSSKNPVYEVVASLLKKYIDKDWITPEQRKSMEKLFLITGGFAVKEKSNYSYHSSLISYITEYNIQYSKEIPKWILECIDKSVNGANLVTYNMNGNITELIELYDLGYVDHDRFVYLVSYYIDNVKQRNARIETNILTGLLASNRIDPEQDKDLYNEILEMIKGRNSGAAMYLYLKEARESRNS